MKNMIDEFKEFINKGDVVTIAVGLVLALYFKTIVDKIIEGVITPILAAIFGETNYAGIGFFLNESFVSVGLVLGAAIDFVVVAFILFLIVKAYNSWRGTSPGEDEDVEPGPNEIELLTEIRDSLRNR